MYVALVSAKVRDGEELSRRLQTGLGPILKRSPGFRGYHSIDAGNGQRFGVAMFDSREDAEAVRAAVQAWADKNLPPIAEERTLVMGEVLFTIGPDGGAAQPDASRGVEARPH